MSRVNLPSQLFPYTPPALFARDRLLRKVFRFISTDTYSVYRGDTEQTVPPTRLVVMCRSALWVVWALAWPLRKVLQVAVRVLAATSPWHKINELRDHLNGLGFTQDTYKELVELTESENWRERMLAAWELALWHSNQYTKTDAQQCLHFLTTVFQYETDPDKRTRALVLQAESAKLLGNTQAAAQELLDHRAADGDNPNLYLALANITKNRNDKLSYINKALEASHIAPLEIKPGKDYLYDLLDASANAASTTTTLKQPLVTVIIPAYNAADTIHTALQSMTSQTWQNLEIIVANDSSTDKTAAIVTKLAQKDNRIKLITTAVNSGPYVARNLALQTATGEYVTCNDSDDWSHPEKIERQVRHLMDHPHSIANASELARAYDDLSFYRRGLPGIYIQVNMSSLMFRRGPVMEKLGYWDSVRFGADSEFIRRLRLAFGEHAVVFMKHALYSFLRQSEGSLTGSKKFGYHGFMMGARKEYAEAQIHHHTSDSLYYPFPMKKRPFTVPYPMLPERVRTPGSRSIDTIIAADFRAQSSQLKSVLDVIKARRKRGEQIGLVQIYTYKQHAGKAMHSSVRKTVAGEDVQTLVYGESLRCEQLIIFDATSLAHEQIYLPEIQARHGLITDYSAATEASARRHFTAAHWSPFDQ